MPGMEKEEIVKYQQLFYVSVNALKKKIIYYKKEIRIVFVLWMCVCV